VLNIRFCVILTGIFITLWYWLCNNWWGAHRRIQSLLRKA